MKIESSNVSMQAFSHSEFKHESKSTNTTWTQAINKVENINTTPIRTIVLHDLNGIYIASQREKDLNETDRLRKEIIELLLERMTGRKEVKIHPNDDVEKKPVQEVQNTKNIPIQNLRWGFAIETIESYQRRDHVEFSSNAVIKTSEGKEFNIDLSLTFTKEFAEVHKERLVLGNEMFADPLIINYKDSMNSFDNISNLRFAFDINNDEEVERIPLLKDGAGFLALDKNDNGLIDDGSELFGTKSGNGFADLKKYDQDNNDWIDENDDIFHNLRIWEKNDKGEDKLITLSQAGIGTLYLAGVDSVFDYHESIDTKIAHLKQSSFFVKENGKAGLITGVDFVI